MSSPNFLVHIVKFFRLGCLIGSLAFFMSWVEYNDSFPITVWSNPSRLPHLQKQWSGPAFQDSFAARLRYTKFLFMPLFVFLRVQSQWCLEFAYQGSCEGALSCRTQSSYQWCVLLGSRRWFHASRRPPASVRANWFKIVPTLISAVPSSTLFAQYVSMTFDMRARAWPVARVTARGLHASSWARSAPTALPAAHKGLERWGDNCPDLQNRSVFIDWRDYQGNYGFDQINHWQVLLVTPRAPTIVILNHKGRNGVWVKRTAE